MVLWLLASPAPLLPGALLALVIEFFLFVWFIFREDLPPSSCQLEEYSFLSWSMQEFCSYYSIFKLVWCRCFLLIAFFVLWSLCQFFLCHFHLLFHRRPPRAKLDARVVEKIVSPISKCLMAHFQLSLPFFELSHLKCWISKMIAAQIKHQLN